MSADAHVKKGDLVVVLSGKGKGKKGKVLRVLLKDRKVLVDGVNIMKRHTRPRPPKVPRGGILEKALPMHLSKVMVVCPQCNQPTRISRVRSEESSRGQRLCKKCGKVM